MTNASELVKVKPLEWGADGDAFEARDMFGEYYRVERAGPGCSACWYVTHSALINDGDLRDAPDEAQSDGQADYNARIIFALDLTGAEALQAEVARLREALEHALNYIENTESELGITLGSGETARAALARIAEKEAAP